MDSEASEQKRSRYHHGDLRSALLAAAEEELREKGPDGFSLRSTAKRAGVSHAAPAHHFKDIDMLLLALAEVGFERLTVAMRDEQASVPGDDSLEQFVAAGMGYVGFAKTNPHLFQLMFGARSASLDDAPTGIAKAADAAFSLLVNGVARLHGADSLKSDDGWRDVTAAWSLVHGYAHLAIGGKMKYATAQSGDAQRDILRKMLSRLFRNEA